MLTDGQPIRRLPRRARMLLMLFVLPILVFSASTRSADEPQPAKPDRADAPASVTIKSTDERSDRVWPVTYPVYDLVNPIRRNSGKVTTADFATLMDRIKQHAACGTWGPVGDIQPFPNNLSLVISHNEAGHKAVEAFLAELRESALGAPQ